MVLPFIIFMDLRQSMGTQETRKVSISKQVVVDSLTLRTGLLD